MARARNIKPGYFTNDLLAEVEPLGRILFAGLWCHADREGRLEDRPKKIKAEILPYDDCSADKLLSDLEQAGFILRYCTEQGKFIQILQFAKHQNPHVKEAESTIPAPDKTGANQVQDITLTGTSRADSLNPITDSLNTDSLIPSAPAAPKDSATKHSQIKSKGKNISASALLASLGVSDQTATDWIALRKAKRAAITQTALDGIQREAGKAGISLETALRTCCERGWSGFKAEWVNKSQIPPAGSGGVQEARLDTARQIMGDRHGNHGQVIDITPSGSDSRGGARLSKATDGVWEPALGEVAGS